MKYQPFKKLIGPFAVTALGLALIVCATQSKGADRNMEGALLAAHFKVQPATTAEQRHQLRTLPDNRFTMVKQGGKSYYLYPDKSQGRLYAGDRWAYLAFVNNEKNNRLRQAGAFVYEKDPSNRAINKTVVVWHGWSPFPEWANSRARP